MITPPHDVEVVLVTEAGGGVMRHIIDLYKGLKSRGWRARLVVSPIRLEDRYAAELNAFDQDGIVYLPMRRSPHVADIQAYSFLKKVLKNTPFKTLLHTHSTKAGILGSLLSSKVVAMAYTPHAYRGVDPTLSRSSRFMLQMIERTYSDTYDRIFAVSSTELKYAKSAGVNANILRYIPNGLNVGNTNFEALRENRRLLVEPISLGFVGRLVYQKNPLLFLEVLAKVLDMGVDARAVIVGDGPLKVKMIEIANNLKIQDRINWKGGVEACSFLKEMDIMVHTSRYEAMPYTLIESCNALLPIVATKNDGSDAILGPSMRENIVASDNPVDLASRIIDLAEDAELRLRQSYFMEKIAQDFSIENMLDKIENQYLELLQK